MPTLSPTPDAPQLNWYGLKKLGFGEDYFQLTGDQTRDQIQIETLCFRIGHAEYEGGLGKFNHFKNFVDLTWNNPESGSMKRCIWNAWANKMFREMCAEMELGVAGCTSAGKCTSPDDKVLMHDGQTKRAGDIRVGDVVMGDDSGPRTVREVHKGVGPMFKVVPAQGEPWYCTPSHTLVLKRAFDLSSAKAKRESRVGEIIEVTAHEFASGSAQRRRQYKQYCVAVDFPETEVPLDPRMFGLWLGDGHIHEPRISIPTVDVEEAEYVLEWARNNGYKVRRVETQSAACPYYRFERLTPNKRGNIFKVIAKERIVDGEKRIGRDYLINSRENRMQLLAGLIDTDGTAKPTLMEITTKYTGLKDDIAFLARSLGFRVTIESRTPVVSGVERIYWTLRIMGDVASIPTFRKRSTGRTLRKNSDCTGITLEPVGDRPWVGFSVDGNHRFLLADFTVVHNSDPAALYGVASYVMDPTHTLVLVMSTSIKEAKKRIWKTVREYWEAVPHLPGKAAWATNEIRGLNYSGTGYGDSSGIYLLAAEQGSEKEAVNKLIGMKAPRTGTPDESFESLVEQEDFADFKYQMDAVNRIVGLMAPQSGDPTNWHATYEQLIQKPEYANLRNYFTEADLRELLPRLNNLSNDRIGKIILIVDEMTGVAEAVLTAVKTNLKPGNVGHCQVIGLGNPNLPYDTFGQLCKPEGGWDKVDLLRDEEWRTESGGLCIRFNAEKNPRILEGNEKYSWMLRRKEIDDMERDYGRDSLYFHRMVLGTWCLAGAGSGIYTPADIELSGARATPESVIWGMEPPVPCSYLDPSFTAGGDRAFATFGLCGKDIEGVHRLIRTHGVTIKVDVNNTNVPVSYQIAHGWKKACEEEGVKPEHAGFDSTGGGQPFGDIVRVVWSPAVLAITSAGPASKRPTGEKKPGKRPGTTEPVLACERFANKATELWYGAKKLLRSKQICGIDDELAKELCSRQHSKNSGGDARVVKVEDKRTYKDREGKSPDNSDSFLGLVETAKERLGLKATEDDEIRARDGGGGSASARAAWQALRAKAARLTNRKRLNDRSGFIAHVLAWLKGFFAFA